MVKRLLVATDLSPRSDRALDRAVLVARQKGAALIVLHVIDDDLPAAVAERRKAEAAAVIRQHLASAPDAPGLNVTVTVVYGEAVNEILRAAEDCDADLVVLETIRMRRWRVGRPRLAARAVLEAEAGAFERWRLAPGDQLEVKG